MPFDLAQFENKDSASFNMRLQNGDEMLIDGKPVVFTMHGKGTKPEVTAQYKLVRARDGATISAIGGRAPRNAEDDAYRRHAEYLAACTISIENWPGEGGALGIYLNHKLGYMTQQAADFGAKDSNFMHDSTTS